MELAVLLRKSLEIDFKPRGIYGIVMVCRSAEGKKSEKTGILQFTAGESLALYF